MPTSDKNCALCERELPLTFHHFVPKKVHKRRQVKLKFTKEAMKTHGIWLCTDCHANVHKHIDHLDLALNYQSAESFLEHPEVGKFVTWVKKQDKRVKK